jgi:hypothetical protein
LAASDSLERKVTWESAKTCLAEIDLAAPSILRQGVIIGGAACWFYRHLLSKANDADFKVPPLTNAQETIWLSKDIDFTNFFIQDARDLLSGYLVPDEAGRPILRIAGIPIGFAQTGLTFDPTTAWEQSWIGTFSLNDKMVQCRILDPVSLYREKLYLAERRGLESDRLHLALVADYLRYETCRQVQAMTATNPLQEKTTAMKFLTAIQERAPEVCRDERVRRRVQRSVSVTKSLTPQEQKLLQELVD